MSEMNNKETESSLSQFTRLVHENTEYVCMYGHYI